MKIRFSSFPKTCKGLLAPLGIVPIILAGFAPADKASAAELPVNREGLKADCTEIAHYGIENVLTFDAIHQAIGSGEGGLLIDFGGVDTLLDNTVIDPGKIYGWMYAGPYPFESDETEYSYRRFRIGGRIEGGRGVLRAPRLLRLHANSEGWIDGGTICIRFDLSVADEGADRRLGQFDTFARFVLTEEGCVLLPTLLEGPFIGMVTSDEPSTVLISFRTSVDIEASVVLGDGRLYRAAGRKQEHQIVVDGLNPSTDYSYAVRFDGWESKSRSFRTAPPRGEGEVLFAYTGDSRGGVGGPPINYMGVNQSTLDKLMSLAWREEADFLIMGGDLVNGFTSLPLDFTTQLRAWKQSVAGFWGSRAIYPAIGNHEALLHVCAREGGQRVYLDRWPYARESAEAIFAHQFMNPKNGPLPSDSRRPGYRENTFSFQYGPVLCLAFNNNYWAAFGSYDFGGSPEGYIMQDQMDWIAAELDRAEGDSTVSHVILYAQEPVFPNGGHLSDAMWHNGNNAIRAGTWEGDSLRTEAKGIVEVRNDLLRLVASHAKVAAVLGSDEHSYHRIRIGADVPVGDVAKDDANGNGRIDWPEENASPLNDLRYDTWYMVSGGAGAPYYSEERAPWNEHWNATDDPGANYRYSSQENILVFRANRERISLRVLNRYGELIDRIDDLTAIK